MFDFTLGPHITLLFFRYGISSAIMVGLIFNVLSFYI
jgi:hypothetical protein